MEQVAYEMIERVAKAMFLHKYPNGIQAWNMKHAGKNSMWHKYARAAIEAMREPTEAMVKSFSIKDPVVSIGPGEWPKIMVLIYEGMIDAALKDTDDV